MKLLKKIALFFIFSAIIGFFSEFSIGWALFFIFRKFLWVYPASPLKTTSVLTLPLWGMAGLLFLGLWFFLEKKLK